MKHFAYTIHNLVGHPSMEVAHLLGLKRLAFWIHNATLPRQFRFVGSLRMVVEAGEYFDRPFLTEKELKAAKLMLGDKEKESARDGK